MWTLVWDHSYPQKQPGRSYDDSLGFYFPETCSTRGFLVIFMVDQVQSGSELDFYSIFWILSSIFGTYRFSIAQLQAPTEHVLDVELPCSIYSKITSGHNLSNAHTFVIIRRILRSQTILVQSWILTSKKKRPPLIKHLILDHMRAKNAGKS